jgi:hypothetical protein
VKREIQSARARAGRTAELAADARNARDRVDTLRAQSEGKLVGHGRERELEQERDLAEARLRRAQSPPEEAPAEAGEPEPDADPSDFELPEDDEGPRAWPL